MFANVSPMRHASSKSVRIVALAAAILGLLVASRPTPAFAASPPQARPVVLELFTSQGCSSCPPADALLRELSRTRADVLALSFHVTYWDNLGWRDPYSLDIATRRQRAYAATLPSDVYTPELVIDGRRGVVGSDRRAVDTAIQGSRPGAAGAPRVTVHRRNGEAVVEIAGDAAATIESGGFAMLVGYDPEHVTSVGRGENGGRKLVEANIVRGVEMLGEWQGGARQYRHTLPQGERIAVLLQDRDGHIIGAARESDDAT